jgi:4-amino-4-deoxy-L-arabinose transferase-like glycosyltransferase
LDCHNEKDIFIYYLKFGTFLRTVSLSDYPSGLNADEAALGYNAYSLLLTGKDEHGVSWPVNLISFGDYKPAGYAYLLIPFVKLLGLTEFAVRIPSAIFGVIAIYILYKLTKEIFNENIALTASYYCVFLLGICITLGGDGK